MRGMKGDIGLDKINKGIKNPKAALRFAYNNILRQNLYRVPLTYVSTRSTIGTNVFSKDWDVLILLDTGRVDALEAVSKEYDFIENVDKIKSVGGASPEWIAATFVEEYSDIIQNTAYLSANGSSNEILGKKLPASRTWDESHIAYKLLAKHNTVDLKKLGKHENIWKYKGNIKTEDGDSREIATPPRFVTERAIDVGRNYDYERLIVHYHQPHAPYTANAIKENRELHDYEENPRKYISETGDFQTVWETYLDELRYVLDDVELLIENLDAERVVISADHGEALDVWRGMHSIGSIHPKVRYVPWITTSATDSGEYIPETKSPEKSDKTSSQSSEELLKALGYKF